MQTSPSACISIDMDGIGCYTSIHGIPHPTTPHSPPDPIFAIALERFLALFAELGVQATFFCIGRDLEDPTHAELFRQAAAAGHELASHSYNHLYNLRSQSRSIIRDEIERTSALLTRISGERVVGFRTPGYNLSAPIARELTSQGYLYDSSLFPCPPYYAAKGLIMASMRLTGRRSGSQMNLPQTLLSPLEPYVADPDRPWRPAAGGGLWEIPMCVVPGVRFPIIGTSLHLLGGHRFRALMPTLAWRHRSLFNLEFHGIDLLDTTDEGVPTQLGAHQPDLGVPLEQKLNTYREVFTALRERYTFRTLRDAVLLLDRSR
ncbi:MAG: polysaccharide deacetylase [Myxococcales bacterium]|nr:polysaccharide deacetylase [Myxococcales bacterium]